MLFMNHIVPDRQLCKILDSFSIVGFFLFLFFLFLTENISLCNYCKFDQRILKAFPGVSVHNHNLTRINQSVIVLSVKSIQIIFPKILCQTLCSCTGTGKQSNLISLFFIFFQIFHKKLKAAVIRGYTLNCKIKLLRSKIPFQSPWLQRGQRNSLTLIQFLLNLGKFTQPLNRKILLTFFLSVYTALTVLFFYSKSVFQNTVWFIQKQQRFFPWKIIWK